MREQQYSSNNSDKAFLTPEEIRENVHISEDGDRVFMARVYNWMAGGLAISGLTSWKISNMMVDQTSFFYRSPGLFLLLLLVEIILVGILTAALQKLSPVAAAVLFCLFALLNGEHLPPCSPFIQNQVFSPPFSQVRGCFL